MKQEFESSSQLTKQFAEFYKLFKKEFSKMLRETFDVTEIQMSRGHFCAYGFFQIVDGSIWYFSLGDVRWGVHQLLVRTAKSFNDYMGGSNSFIEVDDVEGLKRIVSR